MFYFILLTIFLKLPPFKKTKEKLNFRIYFLITLISVFLFFYACYNILTNPTYFFNIDASNMNLRYTILLLFISSFVTFYGFTLAHYYKKVVDKRNPMQGPKGRRGNRGEQGVDKICNPKECTKGICYKRMMIFISKIYSNYLKAKGKIDKLDSAQFTNKFMLNKIKLLCQSNQLRSLIKQKGANEAYLYVQDTWKKWIYIILKYENGEYFLENEFLTDNDFDNLITENDKKYATFENINSPGTPSKGDESPFDELKKFDMYYWGLNVNAMPKIKYQCDIDNKNSLKQTDNNESKTIWSSSNARQAYINFGTIENNKCISKMKYIPFLQKGDSNIKINRPESLEKDNESYKSLGDIVLENDEINNNIQVISGDIKEPVSFKKIYTSLRTQGIGKGLKGYSFWEPVAPKDYISLGHVIDSSTSLTPPDASNIACVPKKCVRKSKSKIKNIWNNKDSVECISKCNCDNEYSGNAQVDTDQKDKINLNMYVDNNNRFKINNNEFYELIPKNEKGDNGEISCFDTENLNIIDNSKWKVNPKNEKKYSIFSIYDKK